MEPRIILVTGGNGELGYAIGRAFLMENSDNVVWLAVHRNRQRADSLAAEFPTRCRVVTLDVTKASEWKRAVDTILSTDAGLAVLVNNAGIHNDTLLGMMKPEDWRTVMDVNLDGVFHGCQAVLPAMISRRSGRIINVSSLSAFLAPAGQTNYAAAKAGVMALTQALAKEVARLGITINAVCPGYINTESLAMDEAARGRALDKIPMRRFGKPEEVAAAVRFFACTEASYITGSALKIDGGIH